MAQAMIDRALREKQENSSALECPICLETCIHPARLPCSHIFCYLCVKGVANQIKNCPMCRQEIPADFVERPQLVEVDEVAVPNYNDEYLWFYEGRNGWWQYDRRTSELLETAFREGKQNCDLFIAGFFYLVDFGLMLQYRRSDPTKHRRIKRDHDNVVKKGVAGLRLNIEDDETDIIQEIRDDERSSSPTSDNN